MIKLRCMYTWVTFSKNKNYCIKTVILIGIAFVPLADANLVTLASTVKRRTLVFSM